MPDGEGEVRAIAEAQEVTAVGGSTVTFTPPNAFVAPTVALWLCMWRHSLFRSTVLKKNAIHGNRALRR
jgi:hypothetical protein